jgi:hypothetical protein
VAQSVSLLGAERPIREGGGAEGWDAGRSMGPDDDVVRVVREVRWEGGTHRMQRSERKCVTRWTAVEMLWSSLGEGYQLISFDRAWHPRQCHRQEAWL